MTYKNPADESKEIQTIKISQLGIVSYINKKQSKVTFELDPLTGELKKVTGESKSVSGDDLAAAGASADSLIKGLKGDNEATKLEAEHKVLELKKKIKDLRDLGIQ